IAGVILVILSLLYSLISQLLQPSPVSCTPPQCTLPPTKHGPLTPPKRYTSSRYGFSLDYSTTNIKPSQVTDSSISWQGQLSDGSDLSWSLAGASAKGRSAQQIVESTQSARFPDAQQAYTVPYASLGYNVGYGTVYDVEVSPGNGESQRDRLLVYAVTRNGLAVVLIGLGPYQQSTPSHDSQPNPANTPLVQLGDFEENINTVTWPGQKGF
ncbi:MAG TPA: hypothetical protein VF221_03170, partial [Chloroflexota bacterium]